MKPQPDHNVPSEFQAQRNPRNARREKREANKKEQNLKILPMTAKKSQNDDNIQIQVGDSQEILEHSRKKLEKINSFYDYSSLRQEASDKVREVPK